MDKLFAFNTHVDELLSLNFKEKAHVFAKDINSVYLAVNQTQALFHGYVSPEECCRKKLKEFRYDTTWDQVTNDDRTVLQSKSTLLFVEQVTQSINKKISTKSFLSVKTPLFGAHKSVQGIFGVAFYLNESNLTKIFNVLNDLQLFASPIEKCLNRLDTILTSREKDCAYYLCNGLSSKEMANHMNISPRTIEKHIDNIKDKLGCYSRQQLLRKILPPM